MGIDPKELGWKTLEWILPDANSAPDDFNKAPTQPGQPLDEDPEPDQEEEQRQEPPKDQAGAEGERPANEVPPGNDPPAIQIKGGHLSALATRAEKVLIDAGVPLYQRGETWFAQSSKRSTHAVAGRPRSRSFGSSTRSICAISWADTRFGLSTTHAARNVATNPPTETAATITGAGRRVDVPRDLGRHLDADHAPRWLAAMQKGYDEATGLLLVEPPPMPVIPDQPTKADAEAALKLIEGLLGGFPFVDGVARAVALSAIITPIVRGAFPVTPMHASRAPTAGSGKSFLWDIVASISIGQLMPVMSTGKDTDETEKRLGAAMMAGQPLISVDNISGELGGDALCQIIERPVVDIRVLGRSERVRIEARGTSTFATGNNFVVLGDMCRRVITANLDTAMEQPELRQFAFDPVGRVLADRGAYIAAALTICRAYIVAGRPKLAPKLASFEGWSDVVRSALIWLGKADPVTSMESSKAEDPERVELIEMMDAWERVIGLGGDDRSRLAEVILKGTAMVKDGLIGMLEPKNPDLYTALEAIAFRATGKRGQRPDAHLLGNFLRRFKGRVIDGKRFMMKPDSKRGAEWWIEKVEVGQAAATAA